MTGKTEKAGKIILVTIDTLRADHLGCYGYKNPTSPNLDALAAEGVLYPYAFSPCSYTVPVHTSLLTGMYPLNHNLGLSQRAGRIDPDRTIFIQEILRGEGYKTGAFVSGFVLRKEWGLDWGFDIYDDKMTGSEANRPGELIRDGSETTTAALEWISEAKQGDFFLWLHYFDVHGPYVSSNGFDVFRPEEYGEAAVILDKVQEGMPGGIPAYQLLDVHKGGDGEVVGYQEDLRHYLAGYDNGIRYEDHVIGKLIDGLKQEGVYDESLIIVTADHGEALGEGGVYFFHGLTVTPEQSRVPLIIKHPAGSAKREAPDGPVSTVDIMPTVMDCAGLSHDGLALDGISLSHHEPDRFIFSENEWQRAVIWRDYYLVREKDTVYDGYSYYFDSQDLCRGTSLLDYKNGVELALDTKGPAGELIRYSEEHGKVANPLERRIKEKDMLLEKRARSIANLKQVIVHKDGAIAWKETLIADREKQINERDMVISDKDMNISVLNGEISLRDAVITGKDRSIQELQKFHMSELESIYNSKSWRLTYPLRYLTGLIKGIKPRN